MATLALYVTPKSSEDAIGGWVSTPQGKSELSVRLTAAPTDGKANGALCKLLAKTLGIPKSSIAIRSGHTSRHKLLDISIEQTILDQVLKKPS